MRPRLVALVIACVVSVRAADAGPGTKVPDAPYPAEFRARVRKAIESGVGHLRTRQMLEIGSGPRQDEIDYQEAAAVTWVLRRAGAPKDDPTFAKAAKRIHARDPKTLDEASLLLLAICAQPLADGNPFAIAEPAKGKAEVATIAPDDRALMERTVKFVLGRQIGPDARFAGIPGLIDHSGGWGTDLGGVARSIELPNVTATYLALLSLEAAARSGAEIPAKTYLSAVTYLLACQAPKGKAITLKMNEVRGTDRFEWTESAQWRGFGWADSLSDSPTGYDTVAGAIGLVVGQDALQKERGFTKDLKHKTRVGIRDALAWVQLNYDITKNPVVGTRADTKISRSIAGPLYHHHWLQGLARLEIHARMRFVGTHDWYQEGAEELVKTQGPGGNWDAIWWSNCYALLFLLRASLPSIVPVVTESDGGPGK